MVDCISQDPHGQRIDQKIRLTYNLFPNNDSLLVKCKISIPGMKHHESELKGKLIHDYETICTMDISAKWLLNFLGVSENTGCYEYVHAYDVFKAASLGNSLESELGDIFGSYSCLNLTIVSNIPNVLLNVML